MRRPIFGALVVAISLASFSGCATLTPGSGRTSVPPADVPEYDRRVFELGEVEVHGFFDGDEIRADGEFILGIMLSEANRKNESDGSLDPVRFDVQITEEQIVEDFISRNAVHIQITGFVQEDPEPVIQAYYSVDTDSSISSYDYLQTVLRRALRLVLPRSRRV